MIKTVDPTLVETRAKIGETETREYYITSFGRVMSVTKVHCCERWLTPYPHDGQACIRIGGRERRVKNLVAEAFMPGFESRRKGMNLMPANGDPMDCRLSNLVLVPKCEVARITGPMSRSVPVKLTRPDGSVEQYPSIRKCADALFCSYQTILDYVNRGGRGGVLSGLKIEYEA